MARVQTDANSLKTVNVAQENWEKKKLQSLNNPGQTKNGAIVCVIGHKRFLLLNNKLALAQ